MKKNLKSNKISLYILRSTYFNSSIEVHIPTEYYFLTFPANIFNKVDSNKFNDFMFNAYCENFNNPNSINKLKFDYENYYKSLGDGFTDI